MESKKEETKNTGTISISAEVLDHMNKLMDYLMIRKKLLFIDESDEMELKMYFDLSDLLVKAEDELWDEIIKLMPDNLTKERML